LVGVLFSEDAAIENSKKTAVTIVSAPPIFTDSAFLFLEKIEGSCLSEQ